MSYTEDQPYLLRLINYSNWSLLSKDTLLPFLSFIYGYEDLVVWLWRQG
jgi:hypothetical protein